MTVVQAVFRYTPADVTPWSTFSYPEGIYTSAETLETLRSQFSEAARFHYGHDDVTVAEHLELPLAEGVFVRIARDGAERDRRWVHSKLEEIVLVGDQQRQLQQAYRAASGDVVMVACVATDTIQWIFDQLDDADTLVIAAAAGEYGVWSIPFAGAASDGAGMAGEPVLGGHTTLRTTVGELMHRQESQQRPLAAAGP